MSTQQSLLARTLWSMLLAAALTACATPAAPPAPSARPSLPGPSLPLETPPTYVRVASFNIKFLGHYRSRDNAGLAALLNEFDLVFVQEVVVPPHNASLPDGGEVEADPETASFFDAMTEQGFSYALSPEPTGASVRNSATGAEWGAVFYRSSRITPAPDLANGYVATPLRANPVFDRVPYAFAFRAGSEDLVFVSVHLDATATRAGAAERAYELNSIWTWIAEQPGRERDYVILGDMNLQTCRERDAVTPAWATALGSCQATNVLQTRPFDQVLFATQSTRPEIPGSLAVINLVTEMHRYWDAANGPYPGDPLNRQRFEQLYSDHNPIGFEIVVDGVDDD